MCWFGISLLFDMFVNWIKLSWIRLWTEITVMVLLLLLYWILHIEYWLLTIRPESWRRLAFWCQSFGVFPYRSESLYIYDDMFVYSYACIILLGVSSRVLFWPADKGKGKVDQPWAWRTWTLVHVGQLCGVSMSCCFMCYLSSCICC